MPQYMRDIDTILLGAWADAIAVLTNLRIERHPLPLILTARSNMDSAASTDSLCGNHGVSSSGIEGAPLLNPLPFHRVLNRSPHAMGASSLIALIELGVNCAHVDERGMDAFDHLVAVPNASGNVSSRGHTHSHADPGVVRARAHLHRTLQERHRFVQHSMRQRVSMELEAALPPAVPIDIMTLVADFIVSVPIIHEVAVASSESP
jgi:hypothetical protein